MKRRLIELTALLLLLGFLGLLVVASGVVPVRASSGHWPITRAFLEFAMRRSVETHSIGTRVPDLDDDALVLRGAGHYDRGCQPCHGAPGVDGSVVTSELTPRPPYLSQEVQKWEPAELFQIVKHGLKMTGMPAWPARERDDEVWAVVAFLLRLPGLDAEEYRMLARGEAPDTAGHTVSLDGAADLELGRIATSTDRVVEVCGRCHGRNGLGRGPGAFPRIAGQRPAYLAATLEAYANGERHSGIMQPVAAALDEGTRLSIARHYGAAAGGVVTEGREAGRIDPAGMEPVIDRGERIAREGVPARKVPSCVACHGPGATPRNPYYPALAGQYDDYLALQLRLFREGRRGGTEYARIMRKVVHSLEADEAEAVAAWYGSLPWEGDGQ